MESNGTVLKASFLVAGTAIGGGMLGMPILTGQGGFIPSVLIFFACWFFMMLTGFLFLEVCLWMGEETNFISMAGKTLGVFGKTASWILYVFMFYTLTLAYVLGCTHLLAGHEWVFAPLVFILLFSPLVYAGAGVVGKLNVPFMVGLFVCYAGFVLVGLPYVQLSHLVKSDWPASLNGLPVVFTAFGYQGMVPTLTHYLRNDKEKVKKAIVGGTLIALLTYLVWQTLILGVIPKEGLQEALDKGETAVYPLKKYLNNHPWILLLGDGFAFFALFTSFLGVGLALRDFLADGLGIKKTEKGRFLVCLLLFVPVGIATIFYPNVFLVALNFAGGFGSALLLGVLPILMVIAGRYVHRFPGTPLVPGGLWTLSIMLLFVLAEVIYELA